MLRNVTGGRTHTCPQTHTTRSTTQNNIFSTAQWSRGMYLGLDHPHEQTTHTYVHTQKNKIPNTTVTSWALRDRPTTFTTKHNTKQQTLHYPHCSRGCTWALRDRPPTWRRKGMMRFCAFTLPRYWIALSRDMPRTAPAVSRMFL